MLKKICRVDPTSVQLIARLPLVYTSSSNVKEEQVVPLPIELEELYREKNFTLEETFDSIAGKHTMGDYSSQSRGLVQNVYLHMI